MAPFVQAPGRAVDDLCACAAASSDQTPGSPSLMVEAVAEAVVPGRPRATLSPPVAAEDGAGHQRQAGEAGAALVKCSSSAHTAPGVVGPFRRAVEMRRAGADPAPSVVG
eukprot:CAMPEP_0204290978 /NCGR_PEP_ID=MMETSP0468-20130131/61617_1 /ASSEMBLY_ACC=CAM_ASM_000383 /TAXON_ID=2969 /ORGANISM="Oxyrrhis marina" /LENGTH=109 /DNA_ID=CAMNT_0051269245 /DNA_START=196 /DNA_END=522 /DNA_ORIENTATION=-